MLNGETRMRGGLLYYVVLFIFAVSWTQAALAARPAISGWRYAEGAVGLGGSIYAVRGLHKAILAQEDAERDNDREGARQARNKIWGYTVLLAASFLAGFHAVKPDLFQSGARHRLRDISYTPVLRGDIAFAKAREENEKIKRDVEEQYAARSEQARIIRVLRERGG